MKRLLIILFSLVPILTFGGQRVKTISMTFNTADFQFSQEDGMTSIGSNVLDLFYKDGDSLPALPHISINVLIAPNERYNSFTYNKDSITTWNNINMKACDMPISLDVIPDSIQTFTASWDSVYSSRIEYTGSHLMDGYRMLSFDISPFDYNGITGVLSLNHNINLSIVLDSIDNNQFNAMMPIKAGINMPELVEASLINGNEMILFYGEPYAHRTLPSTTVSYPYIIITRDSCRTAFEPLAQWKTIKGMRTKILTVEEIDTTFNGNTSPMRIKNALKYYRENHYSKYVLLGGDEYIVPSQTCHIWAKSSGDTIQADLASDVFYACFGDMDWDTNGDGIAAQYPDKTGYGDKPDLDMYPSIIVTRIPAENTTNITTMVNRIVNYEQCPLTEDWSDNVLLCGRLLSRSDSINGRLRSDAEKNAVTTYNNYIAPYWNGELTRFFDTFTDLPGGANYNFNATNILAQLNRGFTFVHVDTHGTTKRWLTEGGGGFYRTNARLVNNSGYSVIATTACSTNAFDLEEQCLSQALLHNPNSGILAYFGSSRSGWTSISNNLDNQFYKSILTEPYHRFGEAAKEAKFISFGNQFNNLYRRWVYIAVNPMGDPEMPVYVSEPLQRTGVNFSFHNNVLTISTNDSVAYKACVTSLNDYGQSYYSISKSSNGGVSIAGVPDSCRVCITGLGYIPYVQDVYKNAYIQNEDISESINIVAENFYAGSNVTGTKPAGDVIIENGANMNVHFSNSALLAPGVTIEKGAVIEILNE